MGNTERTTFIPVLTVMVEYGNAPFLWLVDRPDQGGVGRATYVKQPPDT